MPTVGRRRIDSARLALALRLCEAGLLLEPATQLTDALLAGALAARLLGVQGTPAALAEALRGRWGALERLVRGVERTCGLPVLPHPLPAEHPALRPTAAEDDPLESLLALHDPFGVLGQQLRAQRLARTGLLGEVELRPSEARRDEGAYYTDDRLARRLTALALEVAGEEGPAPSVLDPACGAGTFLAAAFDLLLARLEAQVAADPLSGLDPVAHAVAALHGVELDATALLCARLSLCVRALLAEKRRGSRGQLALFGGAVAFGPLVRDRLRLGDSLAQPPGETLPGTERLRRRLMARETPGRLPESTPTEGCAAPPVAWDADFPLRFCDGEGALLPGGGFDVVVTNPPFVPVDRIPEGQRKQLRKALTTFQRRYDLAIGFVERAATLLSAGGVATLLLPRSFVTEKNGEAARRLLLERFQLVRLEELGRVKFDGAQLPCVALTFVNRRPTELTSLELLAEGRRRPVEVRQQLFTRLPNAMIRSELADPSAQECVALAECSVPLGKYFCAAWGARGTPVTAFHLDAPTGPLCRPMLKGDDVSPFRLRRSSRWLLYDVERLYRPSRPEFFESHKLLVRKVSGKAGLVCAVDEQGLYTDDSVSCVVRKADLSAMPMTARRRSGIKLSPRHLEPSRAYGLHLVAALLQTPLVQRYYRLQLGGGINVFPAQVESLPLPPLERLSMAEASALEAMGRAAASGAALDLREADRLARVLYGLPPAELPVDGPVEIPAARPAADVEDVRVTASAATSAEVLPPPDWLEELVSLDPDREARPRRRWTFALEEPLPSSTRTEGEES